MVREREGKVFIVARDMKRARVAVAFILAGGGGSDGGGVEIVTGGGGGEGFQVYACVYF